MPPSLVSDLRASGFDVDWVSEWGGDPGDAEVLKRGKQAGRILLTLDKDFGSLALQHQLGSGVLLVRRVPADQQTHRVARRSSIMARG